MQPNLNTSTTDSILSQPSPLVVSSPSRSQQSSRYSSSSNYNPSSSQDFIPTDHSHHHSPPTLQLSPTLVVKDVSSISTTSNQNSTSTSSISNPNLNPNSIPKSTSTNFPTLASVVATATAPSTNTAPSSPSTSSNPPLSLPHTPENYPRTAPDPFSANPSIESDRAYLDVAEKDLLEEIQLVQKKLTESRNRLTLRRSCRLLRRNHSIGDSIFNLGGSDDSPSSHGRSDPFSHLNGITASFVPNSYGIGSTSINDHPSFPNNSNDLLQSITDRPPRQRVICVSFRLPTKEDRESVRQQLFAAGLPPKALFSLQAASDYPFVWVGATADGKANPDSTEFQDMYGEEQRKRWRSVNPGGSFRSRKQKSSQSPSSLHIPVALPEEPNIMERYNIFCEEILWRLLHYDYTSVGTGAEMESYWNAYRIVNQRFAEAVSEIYEDGDLIWVHNYQLMLLPSMIRENLWYVKIGFFLYTPFPSAELFRILPHRVELLRGVIGADLIGFHSYDYSKQFVASCSRLLGLEGTPSVIEIDPTTGRRCEVGIYPGGIDVRALRNHVSSKPVKARVAELRARFEGLKIVVGVDRLDDSFGGLPLKLLSYEKLLRENPELVGKVILIQVAMLPKHAHNILSYRSQQMQINELVGRINSAFGTLSFSPVHYINSELDPAELHALMCVGHVCVVSTVRDGMGLIPHEWTVCQHGGYKGPIILSEFAGAAHSFSAALHVNPWDVDEVALKIKVALDMGSGSRNMRSEAAYRFVTNHTAKLWGFNFLEDLEQCERIVNMGGLGSTPLLDIAAVKNAYFGSGLGPTGMSPHGQNDQIPRVLLNTFGTSPRMGAFSPEHQMGRLHDFFSRDGLNRSGGPSPAQGYESSLPSPEQVGKLSRRGNRAALFVLDLDGTLVPFQTIAQLGAPPPHLIDLINELLATNPNNYILIVSGRDRNTVMQWLGKLDVYLAAEDGAFFRAPGDTSWTCLFRDPSSLGYARNHSSSTQSLFGSDYASSPPNQSPPPGRVKDEKCDIGTEDEEKTSMNSINEILQDKNAMWIKTENEKKQDEGFRPTSVSFSAVTTFDLSHNGERSKPWKELVFPVMQHFAERTPGVVLEEGETSVTWYYTESDTDFGRWQARDMMKHLESFLVQRVCIDLIADEGRRRWVKVRQKGVDKSVAVMKTLEHLSSQESDTSKTSEADSDYSTINTPNIDFILCIGDDRADEGMFEFFKDEKRLEDLGVHCPQSRIFTCRIFPGATWANAYVESPARVIEILDALCSKS